MDEYGNGLGDDFDAESFYESGVAAAQEADPNFSPGEELAESLSESDDGGNNEMVEFLSDSEEEVDEVEDGEDYDRYDEEDFEEDEEMLDLRREDREDQRRYHETELFHDRYAGAKFAEYLFRRAEHPLPEYTKDTAHRQIEEAQLFIEAAHSCRDRIIELRSTSILLQSEIQVTHAETGQ